MAPDDLRDLLQSSLGDAYALERELKGGGMSHVFLAEERALGRRVVVKMLPRESAGLVSAERFRREIQLAARLQHPHVVPLLAAGEVSGVPWFTMPFVAGESLRERLERDGPLPAGEAAAVLRDVARALAYAHEQGIVHRDVKPGNVLLSGGLAMVTDFGVAKAVGAAAVKQGATLTTLGTALGTPAYMAPEQALADAATDHRADIYALGCLGYEMLAGTPPFHGRSPQATVAAHISETPEPLAKHAPSAPPSLSALVMSCLEKDPNDRPQTAGEIVRELDAIALGSGVTKRGVRRARGPGQPRAVAVGLMLAIGVAAGALYASRGRDKPVAVGVPQTASLAVLPLATLGGGPDAAYLGDGITEEIGNALASVPGVRVAARTSARAARDRGLDVREVGRTLGVSRVLQGTVQRAGDRLRVNVQLVNAADGFEIWSQRFDRDAKDIFAVQDEIARAIAGRLQPAANAAAAGALVRAGTADAEAHNLYLQGLYQLNKRNPRSLPKAIEFLERAILRDPRYARAHAQLGVAYAVLPDYAPASAIEIERRALAAAARALALDSTIAEAHAVYGLVQGQQWDNVAAEAAFQRGLAAEPNNPFVIFWHGVFLFRFPRRLGEATAELRRALELDPLSLVIGAAYGRALYMAGRNEEALAQYDRLAQIDSSYGVLPLYRAVALLPLGRSRQAVALLQEYRRRLPESARARALLGYALAVSGDTAGARAALEETLRMRSPGSDVPIAILQAALGAREDAVRSFRRGFELHDPFLDDWPLDPRLTPLRGDPRLAPYFERMEALR